jgi:DNA-binding cell septation regulator SpoVG
MNTNKKYLDFIDFVQQAQRAALYNEHIEKFDVALKQGRISIWITIRKSRADSNYFFDIVHDTDTDEKIENVRQQLQEYYDRTQQQS